MKSKIVCDTSALIDGIVSKLIEEEKIKEIIIPLAVLDELQNQASKGRETGFIGLNEIKKIRSISETKKIKIKFLGERPSLEDIKLARSGRIDSLIINVARKENTTLVTSDYVQALVAESEGIDVKYFPSAQTIEKLSFEKFFREETTVLHIKENVEIYAKEGKPGNFKLVKVTEKKINAEEIEKMIKEILDATRVRNDAYLEIIKSGAMVVQIGNYRISIARPPFSDGLEVTIVRPIVKLTLEDYKLSEKLINRLKERAEGILICGSPGSGKSTFAASLAEFYRKMNKIVKTLESPRDMQVSEEITQYAPLEGDFEKTSDILLLVRPDFVIFDEIRKTKDFQVFSDLRLAGIGMVGVVHASSPLDAIQRFLSRVELGMLPYVIDTIIFIQNGEIKKVYSVSITVRIPTGMKDEDLARPIVEVRDFETNNLEYEIYSFGEENIIVPAKKEESAIMKLASKQILNFFKRFDKNAKVEIISDDKCVVEIDNEKIPLVIGKNGTTIKKIENEIGIKIEIKPKTPSIGELLNYETYERGNNIVLKFPKELANKSISIYIDKNFLASAIIGSNGEIKFSKDSKIGSELLKSIVNKKELKIFKEL
ncbi:MAG: PINc/VapC family ATPase [Candidatus Aenigmatarchaeota archaeon]